MTSQDRQQQFHPVWQVTRPRTAAGFFRHIHLILPAESVLCVEGRPVREVDEFLELNSITPTFEFKKGTLWPKPRVHYIPGTSETLDKLADMAERLAEPEVCDHVHAYCPAGIVFQWYDAFIDPIAVGSLVSESSVLSFCEKTDGTYRREE